MKYSELCIPTDPDRIDVAVWRFEARRGAVPVQAFREVLARFVRRTQIAAPAATANRPARRSAR